MPKNAISIETAEAIDGQFISNGQAGRALIILIAAIITQHTHIDEICSIAYDEKLTSYKAINTIRAILELNDMTTNLT